MSLDKHRISLGGQAFYSTSSIPSFAGPSFHFVPSSMPNLANSAKGKYSPKRNPDSSCYGYENGERSEGVR